MGQFVVSVCWMLCVIPPHWNQLLLRKVTYMYCLLTCWYLIEPIKSLLQITPVIFCISPATIIKPIPYYPLRVNVWMMVKCRFFFLPFCWYEFTLNTDVGCCLMFLFACIHKSKKTISFLMSFCWHLCQKMQQCSTKHSSWLAQNWLSDMTESSLFFSEKEHIWCFIFISLRRI